MLLVTPSLAQLLDPGIFLRAAISQICGNFNKSGNESSLITSIAGVVDKLPVSYEMKQKKDYDWRFGNSEGLALLLTSGDQHTIPETDVNQQTRETLIGFMHNGSSSGSNQQQRSVHHVIAPAANTLFCNGRRSTLLHDRWILDPSHNQGNLRLESRQDLSLAMIQMPHSANQTVTANIPMEALTEPRQIVTAMGNIIRRVRIESADVPASTELEAIVPKYLRDPKRSSINGILQVYALIRPSGLDQAPKFSVDLTGQSPAPDNILEEIWQGARIYRVTGGGGGWGKRAGLLSLEPAIDFEQTPVSPASSIFEVQENQDLSQQKSDWVKPGDYVQFYASFHNGDPPKTEAASSTNLDTAGQSLSYWSRTGEETQSLVIGVMPKLDLPLQSDRREEEFQAFMHIPNYFGFLSEVGAAVGVDKVSLPEEHISEHRSRIDVPFTSIKVAI